MIAINSIEFELNFKKPALFSQKQLKMATPKRELQAAAWMNWKRESKSSSMTCEKKMNFSILRTTRLKFSCQVRDMCSKGITDFYSQTYFKSIDKFKVKYTFYSRYSGPPLLATICPQGLHRPCMNFAEQKAVAARP